MVTNIHFDDIAWQKSDAIYDWWIDHMESKEVRLAVGGFLLHHSGYMNTDSSGKSPSLFQAISGGYNSIMRMTFPRPPDAIIRIPIPGSTMFPEEKIRNEVAIMRLIKDQTKIPVPFIIHSGTKEDSPMKLGPFIIMEAVDHEMTMVKRLWIPGSQRLNPDIDPNELKIVYQGMADILLSLSKMSRNRIGSICQIDDFNWNVAARPLSIYFNELIRVGALPQSKLPAPNMTFETTSSYLTVLAELHISHIISQKNDCIDSADDCRRKLIARFLFRKIISDPTLNIQWITSENGPFPLWCDDLRPGNVLVDSNLKITGVIDWEFSYTAPAEFSYAPPWWLLLEKPENWPNGLNDWCLKYEKYLDIFLDAMVHCKDSENIDSEQKEECRRLATLMRKSWKSGDFWIMYAARNNFAFDETYWEKIDQRFFGKSTCGLGSDDVWKSRMHLLQPDEQEAIERYVDLKMEEMIGGTKELAWDPDQYTLEYMSIMESHE
ncbi:hypothetical protein N7456_010541 [Penicillium angulare]|uniref:Aminoglycoside phosphotransferase domain-containing protein n=1 Tax=Penicillium angulare TaxID=116970 RepID=A0A9W9K6L5_9EURO|nr:hypothetical protein N7456_010541 [Penicillium angulare]